MTEPNRDRAMAKTKEEKIRELAAQLLPAVYTYLASAHGVEEKSGPHWPTLLARDAFILAEAFLDECDRRSKDGA